MLGAIKIVVAITILVSVFYFAYAQNSFAEIDDYIIDYQYYQENQFAKFRFKALQDFKMTWEKVENDMIYFKPSLSDIYYWKAATDSGIYGSGGFLEATNELDNLPKGIFEKRFYEGQAYEVFITGWNCGYNGCALDNLALADEMNETHYIVIADTISKITVYFGKAPIATQSVDGVADETSYDNNLTNNSGKVIKTIVLILILIIGLMIIFWRVRKKKHARNN